VLRAPLLADVSRPLRHVLLATYDDPGTGAPGGKPGIVYLVPQGALPSNGSAFVTSAAGNGLLYRRAPHHRPSPTG
jgi:hypothetical protein